MNKKETKYKKYTFRYSEEEEKYIELLLPLFGTKANLFNYALYKLFDENIDKVTKELKTEELKKIIERRIKVKRYQKSIIGLHNNTRFGDTIRYQQCKNYSCQLVNTLGVEDAKKEILANLNHVYNLTHSDEIRNRITEFKSLIEKDYPLFAESIKNFNDDSYNYKMTKGKELSYSDRFDVEFRNLAKSKKE